MNIIFSIDAHVAEQARQAAQVMDKGLIEAVRDHVEQLVGRVQLDSEIAAFLASTARMPGHRGGWAFDRDELQRECVSPIRSKGAVEAQTAVDKALPRSSPSRAAKNYRSMLTNALPPLSR